MGDRGGHRLPLKRFDFKPGVFHKLGIYDSNYISSIETTDWKSTLRKNAKVFCCNDSTFMAAVAAATFKGWSLKTFNTLSRFSKLLNGSAFKPSIRIRIAHFIHSCYGLLDDKRGSSRNSLNSFLTQDANSASFLDEMSMESGSY